MTRNPFNLAAAYERLGVSQSDVERGIQITPQLKAIASVIRRAGQPPVTRRIVSGNATADIVEDTKHIPPYGPGSDVHRSWPWYLQTSSDPDARKVLDAYHSIIKSFRVSLPIEAFCFAASVSPLRILEIITATCVRLGAQASSIVAAVNHPRVVEKTVEMALTDGGHEDRADLHKAVGFLPTAKGSQTVIQVTQNAQTSATAQAASVPAPPAEQTIRRLVNRFNERPSPVLVEDTGSVRVPDVMPHEQVEEAELVSSESEEEEEENL